ncbi:MAG TPA: sugar phosphate nucleotidyltransferase [Chthonomonas sp.]|jgi:UTP--glucose-1-phosphate uridylyltransferase|uniref:UTP--glucose-1-phosphate uridylyltransferase n=1 Tax=Chthonomonas sp. TaxID=2282153 RepID=UPI002B4B46BB|nr:sugar phosphate nucleotidyltransferase [Chthonomonas sp.]HLH80153.1 sugar phosphate nucleotidyltransferase [Chthonomonas sp.]
MSKVQKAVITAAGRGTRMYPATNTIQKEMLPLMDRDGICKPAIQIIIEEALESGIEEVCLVVNPTNYPQIKQHFRPLTNEEIRLFKGKDWALLQSARLQQIAARLTFVVQESPEGFGHAVYLTRDWVADEPFLLMLGDHIYTTGEQKPCARQIMDIYERYECSVSAVQQTPSELLHLFGTVCGERIAEQPPVYEVHAIYEKPTIEYAEKHLRQAGLLHGMYLCFFGMHIFTPAIFDSLKYAIDNDLREKGEFQLTSAQERARAAGERVIAFEAVGDRHDIGIPFGYAQTQAALALNSVYKEQMLAALVRTLAVPQKQVPEPFRQD